MPKLSLKGETKAYCLRIEMLIAKPRGIFSPVSLPSTNSRIPTVRYHAAELNHATEPQAISRRVSGCRLRGRDRPLYQ